jgi:pentapeptide MXKDX repeat protein
MAALFALGVMSIGWMAFIAALIAIEKLVPWKAVANRGVAVLLVVLGLAVAFVPERVPGLTLPDSPQAARAMQAMGMDEGTMHQSTMGQGGASQDAMKGDGGGGAMKGGASQGAMKGDAMPSTK